MRRTLTKSHWLAAQKCPGMAWYDVRAGAQTLGEAERFRIQQGHEVGRLARSLFPDGVVVPWRPGVDGVGETQRLIADGVPTMFEAVAAVPPFTARADVLTRAGGGWHLLEVKSNLSDTSRLAELVDDLAYTTMLFRRSGFEITRASLMLLSRAYRYGDGADRLFAVVEVTGQVLEQAEEFERLFDGHVRALLAETPPPPKLSSACRECAVFSGTCLGAGLAHTVLELPKLHHTRLERLSAENVVDIRSVPATFELTDLQRRVRAAVGEGRLVVDAGLDGALRSIVWPCHYLDFETVATVLPLYPGHACYQQVVTQFSVHRRETIESPQVTHHEYLADPSRDCQRELAEALIAALGDTGSVVVYTDFEQKRIESLQALYPDLAPQLGSIVGRFFDLHAAVRDHVYHPEFFGSFSIKNVLPALVPNLSYADLAIADGDTASTMFARMARGETAGSDVGSVRQALLEYCRVDTLAMVRLHERLLDIASLT